MRIENDVTLDPQSVFPIEAWTLPNGDIVLANPDGQHAFLHISADQGTLGRTAIKKLPVDAIPLVPDPHSNKARLNDRAELANNAEAERDEAQAALRQVEARVEALAEEWRYKGEFGWDDGSHDYGPDLEGYVLDHASKELRAALHGAASASPATQGDQG